MSDVQKWRKHRLLHLENCSTAEDFVNHLRIRAMADYDVCCVLTGKEGSGKSTLSFKLARSVDTTFNVDRMGWSGAELIQIANDIPDRRAVVMDEAFDGMFNRSAMTKANKNVQKFLGISRARNLIIFINFPRWGNLDPYTREHRATHWILIEQEGVAVVHEPIRYQRTDRTYLKKRLAFKFGPVPEDDPDWQEYRRRKLQYVQTEGENVSD